MAEKNLADAFGMTGGTQDLQGLSRRSDVEPDIDFDDDDGPEEHGKSPVEVLDEVEGDDDFTEVDADNLDAFPVGVYLLPDVIRTITKTRRKRGQQNAQIAMDAIDTAHRRGRLGRLVLKRAQGPKRPANSLFPTRQRISGTHRGGQGRKLWTFQATKAEKDVLESLVEQYQAASVSELVSVAVEALHAPKRTRTPSAPDS